MVHIVPVKVVCEIKSDHDASGGRVDAHVVGGVVQELGSGVSLHVM